MRFRVGYDFFINYVENRNPKNLPPSLHENFVAAIEDSKGLQAWRNIAANINVSHMARQACIHGRSSDYGFPPTMKSTRVAQLSATITKFASDHAEQHRLALAGRERVLAEFALTPNIEQIEAAIRAASAK